MPFEYQYITTPEERDRAISELASAKELGVDIEGDSLYHYNERVALIQISGNNRHYIFDPLVLDSVLPLRPLFEDRSILKIFHGADYDVTSLKRDFNFKVGPIFDTALAARAMGMVRYSLKELVSRFFQVTLSKEHQKSDWSVRPLSKEQLDYAAEDTVYLSSLRSLLTEEVLKRGRGDQLEEECLLAEELTSIRKPFHPADYLRIKGANALSFEAQKILKELVIMRDGLAKEKDLPPFKVAHSHDLLRLASNPPEDEEAFMQIFPKGRIVRDRLSWLAAIQKGMHSEEPLPTREKKKGTLLTRTQQRLFIKLRIWRDQQAAAEGVETAMVFTTPLLQEICKKMPLTIETLASIPAIRRWQVNRYGEALLKEIVSFTSS